MQTNFNLLFYLKKSKSYTNGAVSIYARITIDSKRAEFSTGRDCNPERWNSSAGRSMGTKEDSKALNAYLDTIQSKLYEAQRILLDSGAVISAETLKNKFTGKNEKPISLVKIFEDHNSKIEALIGKEFAPGTLVRYKTSLMHTVDFLKWKFNISDIDIRSVNHAFITEYEFYLRSVRNCNNNSAVKYIKNFGKVIRICLANGWLDKNPFANYKTKVKEVERVFLSEEELLTVSTKEFRTKRLNQVRDIFLFSCYTGLAYADVKKLTKSEIVIGIDGGKWIYTHRKKTDSVSHIPLLPMSQAIIDKYADDPQCINSERLLPVLSNQKMNSYLKEIADLCSIEKDFTFHTARHTFATTVTLTNGVPIESVSKMLGHKDLKTTQHYAKILDRKVSDDMQLLRARLTPKLTVIPETKTGGN
jgi:site-specific recombinase XerD